MPTVARVAIYGAGEAGAHLSNLLLTTRAFDPVIFIDDNKGLRGRLVNGHQGPPARKPPGTDQRHTASIEFCLPCPH